MMTTLENRIKEARISAMKNGEKTRRDAIALILAQLKQTEVDTRKPLNDDIVLTILTKMKKTRQESLNLYESAGAVDKAQVEQYEIGVIEEFLPTPLTENEIISIIDTAIAKVGATTFKDMGKVIGAVKGELNGRADMSIVSKMIKEKLS